MSLHTSAARHKTAREPRKDHQIEMAERELRLPDPTKPAEPAKLEDLIHRAQSSWPIQFDRFMATVLDKATRQPEPVRIPEAARVRRLIWACQAGQDGQHDFSPDWRAIWETDGETVQGFLRGLFQGCRGWRHPHPDRYEELVAILADRIVEFHKAAAERQRELQARHAERKGPVARAQAAAAVLEHAGPLLTALTAFDAATRDVVSQWSSLALGLQSLEAAARRELS